MRGFDHVSRTETISISYKILRASTFVFERVIVSFHPIHSITLVANGFDIVCVCVATIARQYRILGLGTYVETFRGPCFFSFDKPSFGRVTHLVVQLQLRSKCSVPPHALPPIFRFFVLYSPKKSSSLSK